MMKKWISKNTCWTKDNERATHTFMDGGKITIPDGKMESFYQMYCECVRAGEKLTLIEQRSRPTFNFFLDVDFLADHEMPQDVFDDLCRFVRTVVNNKDTIIACVTETKTKNNLLKTGIHIHWNRIVDEKDVPTYIKKINDHMTVIHPQYTWDKIIDTSVYNGGGLRMKWSHKYENKLFTAPYVPVLEYSYKQNECRVIPKGISSWMMEQTSIRDMKATPITLEEKIKKSFTKNEMTNRREPSSILETWIRDNMKGQENATIKCVYVHETCVFVNTTSKFCEIKKCNHNSNHVYFYIDLKRNKIYQKCWDEHCIAKKSSARGKIYDIPYQIIKEYKPKMPNLTLWDSPLAISERFYEKATKY